MVIIHKRSVRKDFAKPAKAAEAEQPLPPPFNILQAIFASLSGKQDSAPEQPAKAAIARRPTVKPKQTATIR